MRKKSHNPGLHWEVQERWGKPARGRAIGFVCGEVENGYPQKLRQILAAAYARCIILAGLPGKQTGWKSVALVGVGQGKCLWKPDYSKPARALAQEPDGYHLRHGSVLFLTRRADNCFTYAACNQYSCNMQGI